MIKNYPFNLLFLFFLFLPSVSLAEDNSRDSLFQIWETTNLPDSVRLKAMYSLIKENYSSTPDSTRFYGQMMLDRAEKANNIYYQAIALKYLGNASILLGKYDQAKEYHEKASDIFQKLGKQKDLASSYRALGLANQSLRNYDEALE